MIKNGKQVLWPKGIPVYKGPEYNVWATYKGRGYLPKSMDFESFWIEYGDLMTAGSQLVWNGSELIPTTVSDKVSLAKRSDIKYQGVYSDKRRGTHYWQVYKDGKYQDMKGGYSTEEEAAHAREVFLLENNITAFRNFPDIH